MESPISGTAGNLWMVPAVRLVDRVIRLVGWGLRTFSWRLSGRIVAVFSREERERAVELYFSTPMSTKQVVEHLGYPTGR